MSDSGEPDQDGLATFEVPGIHKNRIAEPGIAGLAYVRIDDKCKGWLDRTVNGEALFGMAPLVLSGLVRIVTHPKIFANPSSLDEALEFCEILLDQPNCALVRPGEGHWKIFSRLCRDAEVRGNLVPDAWLAAMAIESGCECIALDRDFARFAGLKWRTP